MLACAMLGITDRNSPNGNAHVKPRLRVIRDAWCRAKEPWVLIAIRGKAIVIGPGALISAHAGVQLTRHAPAMQSLALYFDSAFPVPGMFVEL